MDLAVQRAGSRSWDYRIAGQSLRSAVELPELQSDPDPEVERGPTHGPWAAPESKEAVRKVFSERCTLGRGPRQVDAYSGSAGYLIEVEDGGSHWISPSGEQLASSSFSKRDREPWVETVLGPALVLALALRKIFCLHASAVAAGGKAALFLGDSGAGKSTLAAQLTAGLGFRRLADDVLPISGVGPCQALPGFPQLSLSADQRPEYGQARGLEVGALFLLEGSEEEDRLTVARLSGRQALEALVRQTVAARLFGPDLLQQHFGRCVEVAQEVPCYALRYPWTAAVLPSLASEIQGRLGVDRRKIPSESRQGRPIHEPAEIAVGQSRVSSHPPQSWRRGGFL